MKEEIPKTLDEAVDRIISSVPEDIKEQIKNGSAELNSFHMTTGMSIRNSWGLWSGSDLRDYFFDLGIFHADDMSGLIFSKADSVIKGGEFDLQKEIERYDRHWEEYGVSPQDEIEKLKKT